MPTIFQNSSKSKTLNFATHEYRNVKEKLDYFWRIFHTGFTSFERFEGVMLYAIEETSRFCKAVGGCT